ncbi:MAG TPA: hypothetical protein VGF24_12010 [Vicinamibacterales bacterium]|jgi:hypothetical protein
MARITVLLIVLALTGGPVANAICITRCHSPRTMDNCSAAMTEPVITGEGQSCPAQVADTPFVREERPVTVDLSAALVVDLTITPLTRERVSSLSRGSQAVDGRRVQPVVLRL